ncbi:MAG: hypothetical protein R3A78_10700 [Polyangiales bacterium]
MPRHAVVEEHAIEGVEAELDVGDDAVQEVLDAGYRDLDRRQPILSEWLAGEVSDREDELAQSLGYFLAIAVYMAFREAFGARLGQVDEPNLALALETLAFDEELRANDPTEVLNSDDVIALGQPVLIDFIQHHMREALEQAGDEPDLESLDRVYRAVLVEIMALSHAVTAPEGTDKKALD